MLPWLVAAISMLMLQPGLLFADDPGTIMSLSLNKGESYIINNVAPGETPAVTVINNPHALVVNNAPGKVVLLGADAGEWTVAIKTTDGSNVKYDVVVKAVGNINDINHPGTSPGSVQGMPAATARSWAPSRSLVPMATAQMCARSPRRSWNWRLPISPEEVYRKTSRRLHIGIARQQIREIPQPNYTSVMHTPPAWASPEIYQKQYDGTEEPLLRITRRQR